MSWMDRIGGLLSQYSGAAGAQPGTDVHSDFDQVARAAPSGTIADGLAAAFRSNQTPAFGQMLSGLFAQSDGEQKAGLLSRLLGAAGPGALSQILGGAGLGGLLAGSNTQITPAQAEKISPDVVQQLGEHAEKANPSIVDSVSGFYAQHPNLVKTLGGAALTIALAHVAEKQRLGQR